MSTARAGAVAALLGAALLGATLAAPAPRAADRESGLLVTLGEVTDRDAVLWIRAPGAGAVTIRYGPDGGSPREAVELASTPTPGVDFTAKARLPGLTPGARHRYTVTRDGATVAGAFVAAPPPEATSPVSFAWSGDLGGGGRCRPVPDGYAVFRAMARFPADFFVFAGDTVYVDHPCAGDEVAPGGRFVARTLPQFWARHRHNRADGPLQDYYRETSVYAIWDDHEVRNDFSGRTEPLMPIGRQAFIDYYPIVPPAEEPGRLYRRFRWGRLLEVFIIDTRQYRSPNGETDGPEKTMLGAPQRRWLVDAVTGSRATWKVIVSSVSLSVPTGRLARDSWTSANLLGFPEEGAGFATERDAILDAFRRAGVANLVFLTADVHHAELLRHEPTAGWAFHEFIAGPLAASFGRPRPVDWGLNPRTLFALGGVENFGHVEIDAGGLTVKIVDVAGAIRFTRTIAPAAPAPR